jgi:GDP-4-dehydro-6-deoxy-D-mannose reductase
VRILVTGSHGFAGTHLRESLARQGYVVVGCGRSDREPGPGETYSPVDLAQAAQVRAMVEAADPELVFHLAADTGRGGEEGIARAIDTNVLGTRNLVAALAARGRPTRLVHVGSSAQYGAVPDACDPVDENAPQLPLGVYGWTKAASEAVALAASGSAGLETIALRPFNHTGPGEPEHLVVASFARQVAAIEAGAEPVIHVGNLSPVRDLTDVRDLVAGYVSLAERGAPGRIYNLCSGRGTRVQEILGMLLDRTQVTIEVRADPDRQRRVELPKQVGSAVRAEREAGWTPRIPLADSVDAVLDEWRQRLGSTAGKGTRT